MDSFPLIRFDKRNRNEQLINGELYMLSSLYYQHLDVVDKARSDPFDGSIPFPDKNKVIKSITGREITNHRLMLLDRFVKCFFCCDEADFQQIDDKLWKTAFSEATEKEIRGFNVDSALIIFSPEKFIKQVTDSCALRHEQVSFGKVEYLTDEEYQHKTKELFENPQRSYKIPFYKNIRFSDQKEFRICVQHPFKALERDKAILDLPESIKGESYSLPIGAIEDACIVSIDNLLKNGILFDSSVSQYYVCEETSNA